MKLRNTGFTTETQRKPRKLAVFASSLAFENTEFAEATENTLRTNGFWEEAENWGRKQDCQA